MLAYSSFLDQNRWIGDYALPAVILAALLIHLRRKYRPGWLNGAILATGCFFFTFALLYIYERWLWEPPSGAWVIIPPRMAFCWFSALPVAAADTYLLGGFERVEDHLLFPSALLVWALTGAAIGAVADRFRIKRRRE